MPEELRLREEGLAWRAVEGELVALDANASVYLAANGSGALLWKALAEGTTRDALVRTVVETFDVPVDTAQRDVDRFLQELDQRGLLER